MVKKEDYPKYAENQKKGNKRRYEARRVRAIRHYGDQCICCRENHIEFLVVTDKNGSPYNFDALSGAGWPEGMQILCRNCQHAMKYHLECPHQTPLDNY